jgi:hypothetical protein
LPGAQVKVPKGYLQSSEIKILYREGSLVQVPLATLRATAVAASAVAPPPTGTTGVTPAIDVTAGRVETADSDLAELDLEEEEAPAKPDVRTSPRPIKK